MKPKDKVSGYSGKNPVIEKIGSIFDHRYLVEDIAGRGHLNTVYRVSDQFEMGKIKALKVVNFNLTDSAKSKRFKLEFQILRRLDFPLIVRSYDFGKCESKGSYFTMEYINWPTLDRIPLNQSITLISRILLEIAKGLAFIHSHGISHLDLKPDNIFINKKILDSHQSLEEPLVKICDFGLSAFTTDLVKEDNGKYGCFKYSAPELFGKGDIDSRADLYALGMIGFTLLSEQYPYRAVSRTDPWLQKQQWFPKADDWKNKSVPIELKTLLTRCLNPDPSLRPRNADEIIASLPDPDKSDLFSHFNLHTSSFVGRVLEKRHIATIMSDVVKGMQFAFEIVGAEGVGKSRLIEEITLNQQLNGIPIIRLDGDKLAPMHKFLKLKVENRLPVSDRNESYEIAKYFEFLNDSSSISAPFIVSWQNFDQATSAQLELFGHILTKYKSFPVMWLLETRTEIKPFSHLSFNDHYLKKTIREFTLEETVSLVGRLLQNAPGYDELAERLHSFIGGKPALLIHSINLFISKGIITLRYGNWNIADFDIKTLSQSIFNFFKVDIERISMPARWVLEWLSVFNQKCPVELLIQELEFDPDTWSRIIGELTWVDVTEMTIDKIGFRLPILREVVYRHISGDKKRRLHLWVGRWLEENYSDKLNLDNLSCIALHYLSADETSSLLRITEKLIGILENTSYPYINPDILEAAIQAEKGSFDTFTLYRCFELLGEAYMSDKRFADAFRVFLKMLNIEDFQNIIEAARINLKIGQNLNLINKREDARKYLFETLRLTEDERFELGGYALTSLANSAIKAGSRDEGVKYIEEYCSLLKKIENKEEYYRHSAKCGMLYVDMRKYDKAEPLLLEATKGEIVTFGLPVSIQAYKQLAMIYIRTGRYNEVRKCVDEIKNLSQRSNYNSVEYTLYQYMSVVHLANGRVPQAFECMDKIESCIKVSVTPLAKCAVLCNRVVTEYNMGYYWQAFKHIRRAFRLVNHAGLQKKKPELLAMTIRIRSLLNKPVDKLTEYMQKYILSKPIDSEMVHACYILCLHFIQNNRYADALLVINIIRENYKTMEMDIPISIVFLMEVHVQLQLNQIESVDIDLSYWEQKALDINDKFNLGQYYLELLRLAIAKGNQPESKRFFKMTLSTWRRIGANVMIAQCLECYGKALVGWGKEDEGLDILKEATTIYESLGLTPTITDELLKMRDREGETCLKEHRVHSFRELVKIIDMLNAMEEPDDLTRKLLNLALESVEAERGFILFKRKKSEGLSRRASVKVGQSEEKNISMTLAKQVYESMEPIFSDNAMFDSYLSTIETIQLKRIHSVACLPIILYDHAEGILYLDYGSTIRFLTEAERTYLVLLTNLIATVLNQSRNMRKLKSDVRQLRRDINSSKGYGEFIGRSKTLEDVFEKLALLRNQEIPVLILGESGTGKELIAEIIQRESNRSNEVFIKINCGTFTPDLIRSALFGHIKGAYTGATTDRKGFFEEADGGTILLDEIDTMPVDAQVNLLRLLEYGEFYPMGDTALRKVNVRVIAAAKDDLREKVKVGLFREDLLQRLNYVEIRIPPLRDRLEDIPLLVEHQITRLNKVKKRDVKGIEDAALYKLMNYGWERENVRNLISMIEFSYLKVKDGNYLSKDDLPDLVSEDSETSHDDVKSLPEQVNEFKKEKILIALNTNGWRLSETARALGISRQHLSYQMRIIGITKNDE